MLTRRDNLLIRPWLERRYIDHRNKVESALPAIDVIAPAQRQHVSYKMKKLQKEAERCAQIEQDNFTLLQHLRTIMKTNRLDNFWIDAPPNFLHRVGIYRTHHVKPPNSKNNIVIDQPCTRKERCLGCNPQLISIKNNIPEERIPWEIPRPRVSRKDSITINHKTKVELPLVKMKPIKHTTTPKSSRSSSCPRSSRNSSRSPFTEPQSIVLTHGGLNLTVNFPVNTAVTLKSGKNDKMLQREFCQCGSLTQTKQLTE